MKRHAHLGLQRMQAATKVKGPVPVTLISGLTGSGKSALICYLLRCAQSKQIAVVASNSSEIERCVTSTMTDGKKAYMSVPPTGCTCCTNLSHVLRGVQQLALESRFDGILVECSSSSLPSDVAAAFVEDQKNEGLMSTVCTIDTVVTVVDANAHFSMMHRTETYAEWSHCAAEDNSVANRLLCHVYAEQIEFANVLIASKTDVMKEEEKLAVLHALNALNPTAEIAAVAGCAIDAKLVVGAHRFLPELLEESKRITSAHLESSAVVFSSATAFHPKRLYDFFLHYFLFQELTVDGQGKPLVATCNIEQQREMREGVLGKVARSKGYVWIGSPCRLGGYAVWTHTGNCLTFEFGGPWSQFPQQPKEPAQEVRFVGASLNSHNIQEELSKCLLTEEEQTMLNDVLQEAGEDAQGLMMFDDPFESWLVAVEEEEEK